MARARGTCDADEGRRTQNGANSLNSQAYVEFVSPQAATAVKRKVEALGEDQQAAKKHPVSFTSASSNPYKTLPKDAPVRGRDGPRQDHRASPSGHSSPGWVGNSPGPSAPGGGSGGMNTYRGGRGGFGNRGPRGGNMGGFQNRNFSGPMGGAPPVGFQPQMGGFQGAMMGGMAPFVGFPNRGNMMGGMRGVPPGPRGGRGGMVPNGMMGGMPNMGGGPGMMGGMPGPMGAMNMGPMGVQGTHGFHHRHQRQHRLSTAALAPGLMGPPMMGHYQSHGGLPSPITPTTIYGGYPSGGPSPSTTTTFSYSPNHGGSPTSPAFPTSSLSSQQQHHHHHHHQQQQPHERRLKRNYDHHLGQPGPAFQQGPQPHFNPAFFPQNQAAAAGAGDGNWNPHGTKRQRPE